MLSKKDYIVLFLIGVILSFATAGCTRQAFNEPPEVVLNAVPLQGNAPLSVYFDASRSYDPDGFIVEYSWDFGDGTGLTGISTDDSRISHLYLDDSDLNNDGFNEGYRATLTVTDNSGATASATRTIKVWNPEPIADFDYWPKNPKVGQEVTFDASLSFDPASEETKETNLSPEVVTSYRWDFGDGNRSYGQRVTHSFNSQGIYWVQLEIRDDDGALDSTEKKIIVSPKRKAPEACFTWYYSDEMTNQELEELGIEIIIVPEKRLVILDASCSKDYDGSIIFYYWDFGDGLSYGSPTAKVKSHYYEVGKQYQVTLSVTDNDGLKDSTSRYIFVEPKQNLN